MLCTVHCRTRLPLLWALWVGVLRNQTNDFLDYDVLCICALVCGSGMSLGLFVNG